MLTFTFSNLGICFTTLKYILIHLLSTQSAIYATNLSVTHEALALVLVAAFVQECTSQKLLLSLVSPCRWRSSQSERRLTRNMCPSHLSLSTQMASSGAFIPLHRCTSSKGVLLVILSPSSV